MKFYALSVFFYALSLRMPNYMIRIAGKFVMFLNNIRYAEKNLNLCVYYCNMSYNNMNLITLSCEVTHFIPAKLLFYYRKDFIKENSENFYFRYL